ncbi:MAG TPA: glutamyl-tRNA reductase [Opitutaceae bacterium]|jgi:glutamyl-tRNA reductase|nr:glutamyl-tRNA reductase [Opitutaceae bacterium]
MSRPSLFLIGATHRTAPFGFRERLALSAEAERDLAAELTGLHGLRECVILSTCNRVEIYGVAASGATAARAAAAYCRRQGVSEEDFARFGMSLDGAAAVGHLLEVAAGLDSQILGETEIFGQAKRAYAAAQERGSVGPVLNRLFQKAFQAAKHVRSTTAITTGQVSVANVAVDLASSVFGSVEDAEVLLLGAGEMGEKSGRAFRSRGARRLNVASRRLESALALAGALEAQAIDLADPRPALRAADIVVCSLAAPAAVLSADAVAEALAARNGRPLLIVDLAMPRNVEPAVATLPNVFLYNLDDLAAVAEKNRQARQIEAQRGRLLLEERRDGLWRQLESALAENRCCGGNCASCPRSGMAFAALVPA